MAVLPRLLFQITMVVGRGSGIFSITVVVTADFCGRQGCGCECSSQVSPSPSIHLQRQTEVKS